MSAHPTANATCYIIRFRLHNHIVISIWIKTACCWCAFLAPARPVFMPPAVSASPRHSCANYPMCSNKQAQIRNGSRRERADFCTSCERHRRRCQHPSCDAPAAPTFGKNVVPSFCAVHYADPCHNVTRSWGMCKNSSIGCRLLAIKRTSGPC